jgi:hypothetical protein
MISRNETAASERAVVDAPIDSWTLDDDDDDDDDNDDDDDDDDDAWLDEICFLTFISFPILHLTILYLGAFRFVLK